MKQFNLKPIVANLSFGDLNVISLGEEGRGRKLTLVPMASNITSEDYVEIAQTKTGNPKIVKSNDPNGGWLGVISCNGTYTRGTTGYITVEDEKSTNVIEVAIGYGADGAAGNIGTWFEYLVAVQPDTFICVKPYGGHKRPAYYLHFTTEEIVNVGDKQALELYCDLNNLKLPTFQ